MADSVKRVVLQEHSLNSLRTLTAKLTIALNRRVTFSEAAEIVYDGIDDAMLAALIDRYTNREVRTA